MWWKTGVVYEVYVRSFSDSDADGVGDLRGVIERLPYLQELGVDIIWLSPFYVSPQRDYGYDVSDHTDVDPLFGDLDTARALIDEAHDRGLKVIIDYVPNHTSDEHPWFVESRSSRRSAKRDWYVWADPAPDGSPPNNWRSVFGGPAWQFDDATGQYYLHSFLTEMPELNWRNPEVEEAMFDVVRLWMGRGADGIRIDCAHYLMKDPEMRDNPVNPKGDVLGHRPLGEYDSEIHLYDKGHEDIHPILRRLRTLLDGYEPHRVAIGEIHIYDWSLWAAYYGAELDELHMVFNFGLLGVKWEAAEVRALVEATYSALPPDGWPNWVIGNHDEPRIATMHGRARARLALLLVLTLRGTPTLYYGDELGMGDTSLPAAGTLDPFGLQDPSLSRDPQRAPMPWTREPNAGFTEPGVEPWVPLVDDASDISVQAQQEDPASMLRFTQSLLLLRKERRELQSGSYLPLETPEGVYGFARELDGGRSAICINFSEEPVAFDAPSQAGRILMSVSDETSLGEGMLFLGPLDGAVIDLPG